MDNGQLSIGQKVKAKVRIEIPRMPLLFIEADSTGRVVDPGGVAIPPGEVCIKMDTPVIGWKEHIFHWSLPQDKLTAV